MYPTSRRNGKQKEPQVKIAKTQRPL